MSSWACVYVGRLEDTEESWHTCFRSRAEGPQQGHVLACKCARMSAHMCSGPGNVHARGFPDGLVVKNLSAQAGDAGSIPGSGISPGVGNGTHFDILASKFHEQRGLVGYSPWRHKDLDVND